MIAACTVAAALVAIGSSLLLRHRDDRTTAPHRLLGWACLACGGALLGMALYG